MIIPAFMKRGTKVQLVGLNESVIGPMPWTVARDWMRVGFLDPRAPVLVHQMPSWTTLGNIEGLLERVADAGKESKRFLDPSRQRVESPAAYHDWAASMGCPFWTQHIDLEFLLFKVLAHLIEFDSSSNNPCIADVRHQISYYGDWRNDPATEAQLKCLSDFGAPVAQELTKGLAAELLDELHHDPASQTRKNEHQQRDGPKIQDYPSFQMKREILRATSRLQGSLKEGFKAGHEDKREELKQAIKARLIFWHDACSGQSESREKKASELFDQYGKYFKIPSSKLMQQILDCLDRDHPDWDRTQEASFWGTLQGNFPQMQRKRLR